MDVKKIFASLVPFIMVGVAIALCIGLLSMFFSIAIWGLLIGAILWLSSLAKQFFFPSSIKPTAKAKGRIIEHNERK